MRFRGRGARGVTAILVSRAVASGGPVTAQFDLQPLRLIVATSREDAERLLQRVRGGEDFAAVARSGSIDPSAADGGLLGRVAISTLRPDLQTALRGLTAGQLTPIVQVPTRFPFFKVEPESDQFP